MAVTPTIEERSGYGRGARFATALTRLLLRPLLRWVPWTPFALRLLPLVDVACVLMAAPRGSKAAKAHGLPCAAEWVHGAGVPRDSRKVILYFHGGGFIACGLRSHRRMIARISAAAGMPALSVAYRKPPRVPIETSIQDCVDAYRWLLAHGYDADDIVIAGDSAGGYFAFATPIHALREGLPRPAGIAALSPFADLDADAKTAHENAALDPYIPVGRLHELVLLCFPGVEPTDPWLCPASADLRGLPQTLIQVGSVEVLRGDAELMAARLGAADVPCTLQIWEGQIHVFQIFADMSREGLAAIKEIGDFARRVTDRQEPRGRSRAA